MEDLEKYIFDPKNPKAFKAYKLLVNVVKKKSNFVFIDPYFFLEIFQNEIFDKALVEEIWDIPSNFNGLSGNEKAQVYINNYSEKEFHAIVLKKLNNVLNHFLNDLFQSFIYSLPTSYTAAGAITKELLVDLFIHGYTLRSNQKRQFSSNVILFVNDKYNAVVDKFLSNYSSIVFTTYDNFQNLPELPKNFHPILLKDISDIHLLLDFIRRDMQQKDRKYVHVANDDIGYLSQIEIKNYFSVQHVKLAKLAKKKEIYLVGENGDGKTLLLQSILLGLRDNVVSGLALDYVDENLNKEHLFIKALDQKKREYFFSDGRGKERKPHQHVFAYGINRFRNDSDKKEDEGYLSLFSYDEYLENPVKWLQNIDYKEKSGDIPQISLATAKEILNELLDRNVEISVSPDKVIFDERGTKVEFNQLSDGYKSVIIWVCDLISRLSEKQSNARSTKDYKGIVLVDEIGVYLHPKWQYSIVRKLRSWFPSIQFIFTTHSPIVIMGASKDAVFYKVYKENGLTHITEPVDSISNLMANGIITSPLFGLSDARPAAYDENKEETVRRAIDTSDDYLAGKIHQAISERIQKRNNVTEDEIMSLIQKELDKLEK